jgi:hypothetical protein
MLAMIFNIENLICVLLAACMAGIIIGTSMWLDRERCPHCGKKRCEEEDIT